MEKLMKQLLQEKVCTLTARRFVNVVNFKVNGIQIVSSMNQTHNSLLHSKNLIVHFMGVPRGSAQMLVCVHGLNVV